MEFITSKYAFKRLTANQLKIIAIIAMLIDHIAVAFIPNQSILGQVMHTIGRVTMPIICYLFYPLHFIMLGYIKYYIL